MTALLARWTEKLAGGPQAGTSDSPPLARVMGVGRQHMKASGGFGPKWMTDLINNIVKEGCITDDWRKSILVPVYKGKGDPLV